MKQQIENTPNISSDAAIPTPANSTELIQSLVEVTQARYQATQEAAYRRASERGVASGGDNGRMSWCRG
jgi:hypothetical protein